MNRPIVKSALIIRDESRGRILMTRDRGKVTFAFPGGKVERGETLIAALNREIREELAVATIDPVEIGVAIGSTVDGRQLTIHMFLGEVAGTLHASAEIEELRWVTKSDILHDELHQFTPITTGQCMKILTSHNIFQETA